MKSFDSLIDPETLASVQRARELHAVVSRNMPRNAVPHLVFCRLVDDQIRLTLDHTAWVARLRFAERKLLKDLATEGIAVKRVSWHVAPPEQRRPDGRGSGTPSRTAQRPGPVAVENLRALAADFEDNDAFGDSLRRLAHVLSQSGPNEPATDRAKDQD